MKLFLLFLSAICCFGQLPGSIRSPATMMQYKEFSVSEIMALSPVMWLDADNDVTPGIDTQRVSKWDDQTANGNNVSQSTVILQPVYRTGVINGHSAIQWFGTNLMCLTNHYGAALTGNIVWFIVYCATNMPSGADPDGAMVYDALTTVNPFSIRNTGTRVALYSAGGGEVSCNYVSNRWSASCCQHVPFSTTVATFKARGLDRIERVNNANNVACRGNSFGYDRTSNTRRFCGWISEYIVFNKNLNEYQLMGVMKYLLKKYNLPLYTLE